MPESQETDGLDSQVIAVIAKAQRIPAESISPQSTFEELKIDSLDGINLVFALEEEFAISIPDEGVQNLRSVQDAIDGVRKLVQQKLIAQTSELPKT